MDHSQREWSFYIVNMLRVFMIRKWIYLKHWMYKRIYMKGGKLPLKVPSTFMKIPIPPSDRNTEQVFGDSSVKFQRAERVNFIIISTAPSLAWKRIGGEFSWVAITKIPISKGLFLISVTKIYDRPLSPTWRHLFPPNDRDRQECSL